MIFSGVYLVSGNAVVVFVVAIVRSQIVNGERKLNRIGFVRFEFFRLGKSKQVDMRFFDFAFVVGRREVKLNDFFTRCGARVRNLNAYLYFSVMIFNYSVCRNGDFFLAYAPDNVFHFPQKARVAKPVPERILNYAVIAFAVRIVHVLEKPFRVCGFVPLIAEIDVFRVSNLPVFVA